MLEEPELHWAIGAMAEAAPTPSGWRIQLSFWPAEEDGAGTPLLCHSDESLAWACFAAARPQAHCPDALSTQWMTRLFDHPATVAELTGVWALLAVDKRDGRFIAATDRLGVQAVHYASSPNGVWRISTHLMWLLLELQHDGRVDGPAFLTHMAFGYTVDPARHVYSGVRRLPPGGYLELTAGTATVGSYWSPFASGALTDDKVRLLRSALRDAASSSLTGRRTFLGLTAGKDSLCLASALTGTPPAMTGTFGAAQCADQLQGAQISRLLNWPHVSAGLCPASDFDRWASYVAFHSAGLATASYVDMAWFVGQHIPPGHASVMGEGGECVRDFFRSSDGNPVGRLASQYMTPEELLRQTLCKDLAVELMDYPSSLLSSLRAQFDQPDDAAFALWFYRCCRMPGNFSQRHAILGTLRPKLSPFLDRRFLELAWGLEPRWYEGSGLHRALIEAGAPSLLQFFESPATASQTVQDWTTRLGGEIGERVRQLLDECPPLCEDLFCRVGTLSLCRAAAGASPRAVYHLLRALSFALVRRMLRAGSRGSPGGIPRTALCCVDTV